MCVCVCVCMCVWTEKFPFNMVHPLEYELVWPKYDGVLTTYNQHKEIK
jgi:hypothetical protein